MLKHVLLFLCLIVSSSIYGQNYLFEEDQSGFSISGLLSSSNGSTLTGIFPGYTLNGKLSFELGIGYESDNRSNLSSTSIRPGISYLVMKQDEYNNPVSVGLFGVYQYNTFSDLDGVTTNGIQLGGAIYHEIYTSDEVSVIPEAIVGWTKQTASIQGIDFVSTTGVYYGLAGTVKFKNVYLRPSLFFSDGSSRFALSFGFLFPQS